MLCLYQGWLSFTKGRWLLWGYGRPVLAQRVPYLYIPGAKKPETSNQQEKVTGAPVLSSWLEPTTHAQEPTLLPLSGYNTALCVKLLRPSLPRAGQSIWPHQRREERRQQKHIHVRSASFPQNHSSRNHRTETCSSGSSSPCGSITCDASHFISSSHALSCGPSWLKCHSAA